MIFTDKRIDEVLSGHILTTTERLYLITETPRFEECEMTEEELRCLSDADLMDFAYRVWVDYVSCM